jgi:hypothetical protein
MPKQKWKPKKYIWNECFVKFALRKFVVNEFVLIPLYYLMSINYENIY